MTATLDTVFGTPAVDSILVPDLAIGLRNNCQSGSWTLGDTPAGAKLHCSILKFSKFFGDLGSTTNELWGQLWIVAEPGSSEDIPLECLMVSYIKTRSLGSFNELIAKLKGKKDKKGEKINPAKGVFHPNYIKHSKGLPDGSTATYYSLEWHWRDRGENDNSIEKLSACLDHDFLDINGTKKMRCLDGLSASEVQSIISGNQPLLEPNF